MGRRQPPVPPPDRIMPRPALILAGLLAVAIVAGSIVALLDDPARRSSCADHHPLDVRTTAALAPALRAVADAVNTGTLGSAGSAGAGEAGGSGGAAAAGGRCTTVTVGVTEPRAAVQKLATGWSGSGVGARPDVWVPDSTAWLTMARTAPAAARVLPAAGEIIATSPVVIAMPSAKVAAAGWPDGHPTWADLRAAGEDSQFWARHGHPEWGAFRLATADPAESIAGLTAVVNTVAAAQGRPAGELTADQFRTDLGTKGLVLRYERAATVADSTAALLTRLRPAGERAQDDARDSAARADSPSSADPAPSAGTTASGTNDAARPGLAPAAIPLLESDLITYDRGEVGASPGRAPVPPADQLRAAYPGQGGTVRADVPYVVLRPLADETDSTARGGAAEAFLAALRSPAGRRQLAEVGLRGPDGAFPPGLALTAGVRAGLPPDVSQPVGPAVLAAAERIFRGVHQRGATLAVFDSSGSMAAVVPHSGGKSKLRVAADAARSALPLFADDSEIGLWRFATRIDGDRDYQELVPLGPVGDQVDGKPRRERIAAAIAAIPPSTDTGLYDTTLAAYDRLSDSYVPGKVNQVVILTDGRNDDPGSISLDDLVSRLHDRFDPRRPVEIITIAYGADADVAALQRISAATDAKSYQSKDPNDIFEVLVNALTDRTT